MDEGKMVKKKVMVAIEESECSQYAVRWTLKNLYDSIANSEVVIFTVQPLSDFSFVYASAYGAMPTELIRSVQERQKKLALALLEKAKDIFWDHGIIAETMTETGDPQQTICEAVEKLNIHLLVLGSHGRGVLKRAFLGSVSNYCLHNAKCSVVVVRKPV